MAAVFLCVVICLFTCCSAYENLALNKPAHEMYPYNNDVNNDASNAVDGLKTNLSGFGGQCSLSAQNQRTSTWWVNLNSTRSIHDIRIYYRTENVHWNASNGFTSRFLGFSIYVSNTRKKSEGKLCYKDTNFTQSTIPAVFNTTCFAHGQYVIYYNERLRVTYPSGYSESAFNDLCEVEVYGCPTPGYYGINCTTPCPDDNCGYCHIETGTCQGGCKLGYKGHQCELECDNRKYGDGCQKSCGQCVNKTQCDHVIGTCSQGCEAGYKGQMCDQACETGKYGIDCQQRCSAFCRTSGICHHITGACEDGCKKGWKGAECLEECDEGKFGQDCNKKCGNCSQNVQCHHINGSCMNGCDPGYYGTYCSKICETGKYGIDCQQRCSAFCHTSGICHHITGACKDGCKKGWKGAECLEIKDDENTSMTLYFTIAAFSVSIVIITIQFIYIIVLSKQRKKHKKSKTYEQTRNENVGTRDMGGYDSILSGPEDNYQELAAVTAH